MKKLLLPLLCCLILSIVALTPRSTAQHTSSEQTTDFQTLPANGFTRSSATVQAFKSLAARAEETGFVRVIVGLRAPFIPEGTLLTEFEAQALDESETVRAQRRTILEAQDVLLARLTAQQYSMEVVNRFEYIPFVAMKVDAATIRHLEESVDVASIEEDALAAPTLAESTLLVGANAAWSSGFTGAGQTVAILDTGVDKFHPFLSGKVVSEACYSTTSASQSISSVCPGGVTSSTASGSAVPPSNISDFNHGTHVAGIAAGRGTNFSGVARDANIIAVQVFSRFDDAAMCGNNPVPCARSYNSDQLKGLERVYALRASYNIAAANMSLGGGRFYSACDAENSSLKAAIDNLRSVNIATAISSGNDGYTDSIGFPACISSAISVGSTGDGSLGATADVVSNFSNSASFLHLLAPGQWINSSIPGGSYANFPGTSMAAPHVAGAWAVLKQKVPNATVAQVFTALRDTGQPVRDARNGITKPRIRVKAALDALGGNNTCSAVPISVGQTVQGTLATTDCNYQGKYADEYTFNGTAGQQIVVSMSSTTFDTFIYLYGTNGQVIAQDDDGGGGTNSRIPAGSGFFTLPATGLYKIGASSYHTGVTGNYTLSLTGNTPPSATWRARDIAVGGDNKLRALWTNTDGRAALWTVSPSNGGFESNRSYGPFAGWTAKAITAGLDNKTRILWTNADGRAALWVISPADGNLEFNISYGPYSNWTATDLAVGADNKLRVLWTHTDGRAVLWVVRGDGSLEVNDTYGPYVGWSARSLAVGSDNKFRVLWTNSDGRAALWTLNADRSFEFNRIYGPYSGWTARDVAVGSDNQTRALWTHADGRAALWVVRGDGDLAFNIGYGPYNGWGCQALAAGSDNLLRALWTNTDGRAALWVVGPNGDLVFNYTYGPY